MQKKFLKKTLFGCMLVIVEVIIVKLLQYQILPAKYFYDSGHILAVMNGSIVADKTYVYAADFFNTINIFKFTTLQQWSWAIGSVFAIVLMIVLLKERKYTLKQYIFIYASVGLLAIYVFNLSKDIIQFLYFFVIYLILSSKLSNIKKLVLCCLVLVYEALNFRIYYLIMAILMITMYFVYNFFIKDKIVNKRTAIKIIGLTLIAFFIQIFVLQLVSVENFNTIMLARSSVNVYRENSLDAVTIIEEPLGTNTNYLKFIGNYMINIFRIMIPLELLGKGIKYIPFIIYQLFVTYNILKLAEKINNQNIMWLITAISFMMISIIFEPDFGSFIRHEAAMMLILLKINILNSKERIGSVEYEP